MYILLFLSVFLTQLVFFKSSLEYWHVNFHFHPQSLSQTTMSLTQFNIPLFLSLLLSISPSIHHLSFESPILFYGNSVQSNLSVWLSLFIILLLSLYSSVLNYFLQTQSSPKDFVFYFHSQFLSQEQVFFNSLFCISTVTFVISFTFNLSFSIINKLVSVSFFLI